MEDAGHHPWYIRLIFWLQTRHYGAPLNSAKIWATSPRVFLGLSHLYSALDRTSSPLSPALRSLVIVRVSQLNGCAFCIDLNTSVLLKRGVSLEKALALHAWSQSTLFSPLERDALSYSESVTRGVPIDAHVKERLTRDLAETGLVELTALIAFQNMSTKFNNAFDVAPQGFCPVLIPPTQGEEHRP
ncbi:MAG: carboxymuconolactone decarboxylase family protein [Candidatus Puniceispirillum sp.]|nr:carboxymuconolactone decarboxylase family protein [Candidatus Puniceispirillum sp.]